MRRKIVCIEGIDKAGKSTFLENILKTNLFKNFNYISFPSRATPIGNEIRNGLEFGDYSKVSMFNFLMEFVYSFEKLKFEKNENNIIMDRYFLSTLAYQCFSINEVSERTEKLQYIMDLVNRGILTLPTVILFLEISPEEVVRRTQLDYEAGKNDVHDTLDIENIIEKISRYEKSLEFISNHFPQIEIIKANTEFETFDEIEKKLNRSVKY